MHDRVFNPIGVEESLLVLRLMSQGADAFYLAELRLQEKMLPARLSPFEGKNQENGSASCDPSFSS